MDKTSNLLKPCECNFCSQFYFIRIQKYIHKKNLRNFKELKEDNRDNFINIEKKTMIIQIIIL